MAAAGASPEEPSGLESAAAVGAGGVASLAAARESGALLDGGVPASGITVLIAMALCTSTLSPSNIKAKR